jgi:predicted AAA+ superfamily ATPase
MFWFQELHRVCFLSFLQNGKEIAFLFPCRGNGLSSLHRTITSVIQRKIGRGKAIMIIGPRQVGKTTLIWNQLRGEEVLRNWVNSYLYRDILSHGEIRKPEILEKLVQGLALQIGREVNYPQNYF